LSNSSKTSSSSAEDGDATAASSEETSDGSSGSSNEGEIAGMSVPVFVSVIGGIVVVGALALLGVCLCVKKKGRTQTRGVAEEGGPGEGQGREMNNNPARKQQSLCFFTIPSSSPPLLQRTPSDTDVLRSDELSSPSNPQAASSPLHLPTRRRFQYDERALVPVAARGCKGGL